MRQQKKTKKPRAPTQLSFKRRLTNTGYSEDAADKIWNWYSSRIIKQQKFSEKAA
jgi:hypothetical protein